MKQKEKKVLVTGASGFVGSYLCEELLERGYNVVGLVYGEKKNVAHLANNKNFKIIEGDITDFKKIFKILKNSNPKVIFHTAALIPNGPKENPCTLFKVNVVGTVNLLESCRILGIKNIIYSSSMSVYGKDLKRLPAKEDSNPIPSTFYGLSKWSGEECANIYSNIYKLNVIILRYTGIYGLGKNEGAVYNFFKTAISNKPLEILSDTSWDIVYVKDVVLANIKAYKSIKKIKSETINIGSGEEINIKYLARKIIKISGSKSVIKIKKTLPHLHFYADINKAKRLLGFKATRLNAGLKDYFQKLKEQK